MLTDKSRYNSSLKSLTSENLKSGDCVCVKWRLNYSINLIAEQDSSQSVEKQQWFPATKPK